MKTMLMVLVSVLLVSVGVVWGIESSVKSTPAPVGTPAVEEKIFFFEVEEFNLTNADVQDLEGASGGKVVVLKDDTSKAEASLLLSKGNYEVVVYELGPSEHEDAFYLKIGNKDEMRMFPEEQGEISQTLQIIDFTQEADGTCNILITFAEPNVQLDSVEFKFISNVEATGK